MLDEARDVLKQLLLVFKITPWLMNAAGNITPLKIVATFVSLTEAFLIYAVTKVTGGVQMVLTGFAIVFALLVLFAFFYILWKKNYVFFSPLEFGDKNPAEFVAAMTLKNLPEPVQFSGVNSLLDNAYKQFVILMHTERRVLSILELPEGRVKYELEVKGDAEDGDFDVWKFCSKLKDIGYIELLDKEKNKQLSLTKKGHDFARWLIDEGEKASFMKTEFGEWGKPVLAN